ncbi:hypothetical protein F4802DRAFT_113932 [Xylaria palmicola]|nr:hypothetical protein F4802DRAFT_113932 [Xylaria palmicola]
MSSGERNTFQSRGMDYGASVAGTNVDFADESSMEAPGTRDRALIDKLKDALRPGDARRRSETGRPAGDMTHDGRHGGIEEVMKPGNRDYDEREEAHRAGGLGRAQAREQPRRRDDGKPGGGGGGGGGGVVDAVRRMSVPEGREKKYNDSTDVGKADEDRVPGSMYHSIRDDLLK